MRSWGEGHSGLNHASRYNLQRVCLSTAPSRAFILSAVRLSCVYPLAQMSTNTLLQKQKSGHRHHPRTCCNVSPAIINKTASQKRTARSPKNTNEPDCGVSEKCQIHHIEVLMRPWRSSLDSFIGICKETPWRPAFPACCQRKPSDLRENTISRCGRHTVLQEQQ